MALITDGSTRHVDGADFARAPRGRVRLLIFRQIASMMIIIESVGRDQHV